MKTLKITNLLILMFVISLFSKNSNSQEVDGEYHSLDQMMGAIKLEKKQVEAMVDTLVKSGRITTDEADRAKREIASVKEEDFEAIKSVAIEKIKAKKVVDNK